MIKILVCIFLCAFVSVCIGQNLGAGTWSVVNIKKCVDPEKYHFQFDVKRYKVNRTHDVFDGRFTLEEKLECVYSVYIEVCKHVDGGCKQYTLLTDNNFCEFINKYAKANREKALAMAGCDPPDLPLAAGEYVIEGFHFDYGTLPPEAVYGKFDAIAYLVKGIEKVGCIHLTILFSESEE